MKPWRTFRHIAAAPSRFADDDVRVGTDGREETSMERGGKLSETATTAPGGARRFVRDSLADCDVTIVDDAALLVSEITTSCMVSSGATAVRINVLQSGRTIRVEVHEPPQPVRGPARPSSGYSAEIVGEVADRWGVDDLPTGRVVWFELEPPTVSAGPPQRRGGRPRRGR